MRATKILSVAVVTAGGLFSVACSHKGGSLPPPAASSTTTTMAALPVETAVAQPVAPKPTCPEGMIEIPGGHFFMGSDQRDALENERPSHKVTLSTYCIDKYEVTVAKYNECSDRGDCRRAARENVWSGITEKEQKTFDPLCNARDPEKLGNHPVNCVDWDQAAGYCKWRGGRLPTEAEWEFAARGPDGRVYPWGDEPPSSELLNSCGKECLAWGKKNDVEENPMYASDDGFATTAPVGSFPKGASRFGLEDVVGNVWEWVADWSAGYSGEEQADPHGPPTGTTKIIRGGAWNGAYPAWVRPTFRYRDVPTKRSYGIGFRCAASLPE
jgi:formylglycine-generating enzyme required for sulfatase activity